MNMRASVVGCWSSVALSVLVACGSDGGGGSSDSAEQLIGIEGGTIEMVGGGKVEIPAGALSKTVKIKITKLELSDVAALPDNMEPAGKPFAFTPHGQMFLQPVKIEVPFEGDDTEVRPMKLPNETADTSMWTTVFPSEKDTGGRKLSMESTSFSVILAARPRRITGIVTLPDGAVVDVDGGVAGNGGTGATGGLDGGGSGGAGGSGFDASMDASSGTDADVDATVGIDGGPDSGVPFGFAYIKASNTAANDLFGNRLALDGDTLVVGAQSEDSSATGVNGDQTSNGASASGAVYVFVRGVNGWVQEAYLKASNTQASDGFGQAVAVSGDTIVVGAPQESSDAQGVNGDGTNNNASRSGAAYVFVRTAGVWSQQAYLKPSNTLANFGFGTSVAIDIDTIVVGAPYESSSASGINGNQSDTSMPNAGAAYVFERVGNTWSQDSYLKASNTGAGDEFGGSVAIHGSAIVVGAIREDSNATGVDGDGSNNLATDSGAAYLFQGSAGSRYFEAYLKASNTGAGDVFGWAVAVSGGVIVVGAPAEDSNATGVNGDGTNNLADLSGAAYLFGNNEGTWEPAAYLKASNTGVGDQFGTAVAVFNNVVVIGAKGERSNATGIDGDGTDNTEGDSGAAYVLVGSETNYYPRTWNQAQYVKAINTEASDDFGAALAISATTIAVGASGEDSNAIGVNGNPSDNTASSSGAAYVVDLVLP